MAITRNPTSDLFCVRKSGGPQPHCRKGAGNHLRQGGFSSAMSDECSIFKQKASRRSDMLLKKEDTCSGKVYTGLYEVDSLYTLPKHKGSF